MPTESASEDPETESEDPLMLILAVGGILLFGFLLWGTVQVSPLLGLDMLVFLPGLFGLLFPLLLLYLLWRLVVAIERLASAAETVAAEREE